MKKQDLKFLLMYLKKEKIIEEYEELFDKVFDFSSLLNLSKNEIHSITNNKETACIRLYEAINKVKIEDELIDIYLNSKKEYRKYLIRVAISDLDLNMKKDLMNILSNGKNVDSTRYAYSLIRNEKIRKDCNLKEYVYNVSNCDKDVAYKMREFIETRKINNEKISLPFLDVLGKVEDSDIASYLIRLYEDKKFDDKDLNIYMTLSLSNSSEHAKNAYIALTNEKLKDRDDILYIALSIATADTEFQSRKGLTEALDNCESDNLVEKVAKSVNELVVEKNSTLFKDVLSSCIVEDILLSLNSIPDFIEVDSNTKVKVKS